MARKKDEVEYAFILLKLLHNVSSERSVTTVLHIVSFEHRRAHKTFKAV
jgi:hypothetical protein